MAGLPFLAVSISSSVQRELSFISRLAVSEKIEEEKKKENHEVREGGRRRGSGQLSLSRLGSD